MGAALLIVASASATAVAAFREVDAVVGALREGQDLQLGQDLAEADAGKPQTIMVLGSDKRSKGAVDYDGTARSDTIILVRLDPSKNATALLSLPRDLKVRIPGHGSAKVNEAYTIGGPKLTLRTVKRLTGLSINHVINVDFQGFRGAVNEVGCVYADMDRRYFNDNTGAQRYATIDIQPGYQKLCGQDALDYVRHRHSDNDIVRAARQQDFLRQAKDQARVGELFQKRGKLVKIFGRYTDSDSRLRSRESVLRLVKLVFASAGRPIREVHFKGRIGFSFVTASSRTVKRAAAEFLGVEATDGPITKISGKPRRSTRKRDRRPANLEDATGAGRDQAAQAAAAGARIPIFYPRQRLRGAIFKDAPRVYAIRDPEGKVHNSYRMVLQRGGVVPEYHGLQGTAWKDPPILQNPSEKRRIRGRLYELHYDGDRLRLVAWRTKRGAYWLTNSLLQTLTERQMLGIAASTRTL